MEAPTELRLQGSYYDTRRFDVSLVLNNKGPDSLPVEITVHSLHGDRLDLPTVELPGETGRILNLNEALLEAGAAFQKGSLELRYSYEGCALVLSAGIILEDPAAGISFDELLTRSHHRVSRRLEGLWWVPSRSSKLELVLSNHSESSLTVAVTGQSLGRAAERKSLEVDLDPRETRVINLPRAWTLTNRIGRRAWTAGSLSVTYDGEPDDLVARGMIEDRAIRYSGVVEFSDPEAEMGQDLQGTGWRLGSFADTPLAPVLVVRSVAEEDSTLTVGIPYTNPEGEAERLELEPITLEPGEIRDLSADIYALTQNLAPGQIETAGLEIRSSGGPGTLLAAAESVSLDGARVFRLPLVDPQTKGAAGNYPWRISDYESTVVYLKNVTDRPRQYSGQLNYEGGAYTLGLHVLAPGETVRIDIREIRDSQQPDDNGTILPVDLSSGQLHWSAIGSGSLHSMVGRSEYFSPDGDIASTFACSSCCGDSYESSLPEPERFFIPDDGGFVNVRAIQVSRNCYGSLLQPYYVTAGLSWISEFPYVADIVEDVVAGFAPGVTTIIGEWETCNHYYIGYPIMQCQESCHDNFVGSDGNILHLDMLEPAPGGFGYSISDYPTMPLLQGRARLRGYGGGLGPIQFDWTYTVDWTGDQGVHTGMTWTSMGGGPTAIGSEETTWDVPINWILGGNISATVEVILPEGDPSLYRVSLPNIRTIRGTNPSSGAVKGYIDSVMPPSPYWFAKRMANHESGYRQFGGDGMPLPNSQGDGGYGIFQLTPPRNPMNQVWDFHEKRFVVKGTDWPWVLREHPVRVRLGVKRSSLKSVQDSGERFRIRHPFAVSAGRRQASPKIEFGTSLPVQKQMEGVSGLKSPSRSPIWPDPAGNFAWVKAWLRPRFLRR